MAPEPTIPRPTVPGSSRDALADARRLAASDRENFVVLSRLVPPHLRDDFASVYAFCRHADDLADEQAPGPDGRAAALALLAEARVHLHAAADGLDAPPLFTNLAETIHRHAVPLRHFDALLDAFEQDQRVTRYRTWDQLSDYCTRSADPVGRVVLTLAGHRPSEEDPETAPLETMSDRVCTGLQLANFWQDVGPDLADRDRVYLPIEETGLEADVLRTWASLPGDPEARERFAKALKPLVLRTRILFNQAEDLHRRVDPAVAAPIWLFRRAGIRLLDKIENGGCSTLWHRPRIGKADRLSMLIRAWWIARRAA
jgi:squalene synthase HpnC